ncbi:unnamed protein product [Parascedosporium putredinis]|uniref:Allantoinase n=1 Tax=Parascedosporium putredinis TaxID=1442378 RepID=A0A9P1H996_9PEZI|nr:unnamed protein product [Parascedosporium putredinis]CAI8000036.1 unnamed protein product [Parascedosporium putredinis]
MALQVVLTSTRAILTLPDNSLLLTPATITISPHTGRITSIILLPGLVDAHVHLNEPGRTEWEGFETGTRAAAAGGVTTVVDMPLNAIPPTTTVEEFPAVTPDDVASAMRVLQNSPTTLIFETSAVAEILKLAPSAPALHLHIVHLSATECIPLLRKARAEGLKITAETCFHYLELAAESIEDGDTRHKCCPPIRTEKNRDALWAELMRPDSCIRTVVSDHSPCTPELKILPHRLGGQTAAAAAASSTETLADSAIEVEPQEEEKEEKEGEAGRETKVTPGDFMAAWGGISSVGLGLPILHTAARERNLSLSDIVRLCCVETARQVGLAHRKGSLKVGLDADVCVFDDTEEWTLTRGEMRWKNNCSPWEGKVFCGRVKETWVRGHRVWDGQHVVGKPLGECILEKRRV